MIKITVGGCRWEGYIDKAWPTNLVGMDGRGGSRQFMVDYLIHPRLTRIHLWLCLFFTLYFEYWSYHNHRLLSTSLGLSWLEFYPRMRLVSLGGTSRLYFIPTTMKMFLWRLTTTNLCFVFKFKWKINMYVSIFVLRLCCSISARKCCCLTSYVVHERLHTFLFQSCWGRFLFISL